MAVAMIFGNPGLQQHSALSVQSPCQDDLMQDLLSSLGVCPQYLPNLWLQDHNSTHSATQASGETSVYSNQTENTHPIKTEEDSHSHVQVKTEICSCDVCGRLFSGACHLLQFEENILGCKSGATGNKCYREENTPFSNTTALRSENEHLAEFTCEVCGEKLVENQDICNISKDLCFSSKDTNKHFSDKFCLTCLMNNSATSIHEKFDMLADVTNGIEYECSVCMAVFQSRKVTYKHMNTHDRIQNHVCPFCEKQFSDGKQFYSHFLTHENEQEFTCGLCHKVFTGENKYRSHVKSHTVEDTSSKPNDDGRTDDTHKYKSSNDNMFSATSRQDVSIITNGDVSARLHGVGDNSTKSRYKDQVESVESSSKRNYDSNMAFANVPAVINDPEACDAASSNKRKHDINLKSIRDLKNKENCSEQDRLEGSLGSVSEVICLEIDHAEIGYVGKPCTKKGTGKPEVEEYYYAEGNNEGQEDGKSGYLKASSNGNKRLESGQTIDNSRDQEAVDDDQTETENEEKNKERNGRKVQQRERNTTDQKQSTSRLRDIKSGGDSQDILPEDTSRIENKQNELKRQVETDTESEKEEYNLTWKKYNIDKSKKLQIRKTLVLPKTQHNPVTKRLRDGNNNEVLSEDRKLKQQKTTTAVEAKKHSHTKNKKKPSHDKNSNLTSDKCEKWDNTKETAKPSVTTPSECNLKDKNGNTTLISNFLLSEESLDCIPRNQKQTSKKRHLSKRNWFESEWTSDGKEDSSGESTLLSDGNTGVSGDIDNFSEGPDSSRKPFKCIHCLKTFRRRFNLSRHMLNHEGAGPYQCDVCSKNCQSRGDLVKHMTVHTGDHPFQCDICQKAFTQKVNLKRHMATHIDKDTQERISNCFRCDVCNKGFTQKTHMERHRRLHTGEKRYKCHICSEWFFESHHLKRHLAKHEKGNILKCPVCKMKFTRRLEYSRHLRTHKQFKDYRLYTCDVCDRGYDTRFELIEHMSIHTGEKPYHCAICNEAFRCKDGLRGHTKSIKHKRKLLKLERRQSDDQSDDGNLVL